MTDPDLEWLLCHMAAAMGQRSGHGSIVAVLEGGGGGAFDAGGAEATIERARPHVARARRLRAIWAMLDPPTRRILEAYYVPRPQAPGIQAWLGLYAMAALHLSSNRQKLEQACSNAFDPANQATIRRELGKAERAVREAHRAWRSAKAEAEARWVRA